MAFNLNGLNFNQSIIDSISLLGLRNLTLHLFSSTHILPISEDSDLPTLAFVVADFARTLADFLEIEIYYNKKRKILEL